MKISKTVFEKNKIKLIKFFVFAFFTLFGFLFTFSADVFLDISVDPGQITWGVSSGLSLGSIEVGQTQQVLTGQFAGYFWVQDLKGSDTGWTATVLCDGLYGPQGSITGIYLKAGNSSPTLLLGSTGNVFIGQNLLNYYPINTSVVYINRPQGQNNGTINKYGDIPHIKVIIPPYTIPGNYSGTIYFDLQ